MHESKDKIERYDQILYKYSEGNDIKFVKLRRMNGSNRLNYELTNG